MCDRYDSSCKPWTDQKNWHVINERYEYHGTVSVHDADETITENHVRSYISRWALIKWKDLKQMFSGQKTRSELDFGNIPYQELYRKVNKYDKTFKNITKMWNFTPYRLGSIQPYPTLKKDETSRWTNHFLLTFQKENQIYEGSCIYISVRTFTSLYIIWSILQEPFISVGNKKSFLRHADSDLIPLTATKLYYTSVL